MPRAPARGHDLGTKLDTALLRELECIAEKVVQHLLQALWVGGDCLRQTRLEVDRETQLRRFGHMAERALEQRRQLGQRPVRDLQSGGTRLELGQVEDVVDEVPKAR